MLDFVCYHWDYAMKSARDWFLNNVLGCYQLFVGIRHLGHPYVVKSVWEDAGLEILGYDHFFCCGTAFYHEWFDSLVCGVISRDVYQNQPVSNLPIQVEWCAWVECVFFRVSQVKSQEGWGYWDWGVSATAAKKFIIFRIFVPVLCWLPDNEAQCYSFPSIVT